MTTRRLLKARRAHHTFPARFNNTDYTVGFGVFDDGAPAEVFVTGAKAGSDVQGIARDAAVLLSLALQYGVPLETVRHSVTRSDENNTPASLVGLLADSLHAEAMRLRRGGNDAAQPTGPEPVGGAPVAEPVQ